MGSGLDARTVHIVVTPGSGSGRARYSARRLRRLLGRRQVTAEVQAFNDLDSLRRWAREVEPDFDHLVCVGGDATLSAAATAAIRHDVPFVPVPNGFGNVFAQVFGHSDRAEAVIHLLERGEVHRVDVGAVGDEVFLSHRSYGLLEQVQQAAERGRHQPKNHALRYLWYWNVGRRFLFSTRLAGFQVDVDGARVAEDAVLVTVANVETYRGFLSLTPTASPIDGMFDVFVIPRTSKPRLAWRLFSLWLGRSPRRWKGTAIHRGRRVSVTTPRRHEELRVRRRALPLLVPPGAIAALKARTVEDPELPASA
ncbi:MAG TPA: diacylglycerol kinase family protein [Methylomirabilota bacterium]|nr:diacylglycerol kinase family protein [Methylomirabilota bacterium]